MQRTVWLASHVKYGRGKLKLTHLYTVHCYWWVQAGVAPDMAFRFTAQKKKVGVQAGEPHWLQNTWGPLYKAKHTLVNSVPRIGIYWSYYQ